MIEGLYTRSGFNQMFDEARRYVGLRLQRGVPLVDADFNDVSDSVIAQLRRVIQLALGSGASGDGFMVAEAASTANNFRVSGGDGTDEGAGQAFIGGLPCRLNSAVDYASASKDIHAQVSGVVPLVLEDDSASWIPGELVGRDLVPDIDFPATTHAITSNTATTITIGLGDLTGETATGKHYRVNLTTPGAPRSDEVYLDVFLDEVSTTEDADLLHTIGAPPAATAAAFRLAVRQVVRVREGGSAPSASFVDGTGRRHHFFLLASISRSVSIDIFAADIADVRAGLRRGVIGNDYTPSVSNGQTIFHLPSSPFDPGLVVMVIDGIVYYPPTSFTVGGVGNRTITWLGAFALEAVDEVRFYF